MFDRIENLVSFSANDLKNILQTQNGEFNRSQLLSLQDALRRKKLFDKQYIVTKNLVERYKNDPGCLQAHVTSLINTDRLNDALECADCLIKLDHGFRSFNIYFEVLYNLGLYIQAGDVADKMILMFPENPVSYVQNLRLYKKTGNVGSLMFFLMRCSRLFKNGVTVHTTFIYDQIYKYLKFFSGSVNCTRNGASRFVVFLPSGGVTHMLTCLGAALEYSRLYNRRLIPLSGVNRSFELSFYDIFDFKSDLIVSKDESQDLTSDFYDCTALPRDAYTFPVNHTDGHVYYIMKNCDHPLTYHFPSDSSADFIPITGFDCDNIFNVCDKIEFALNYCTLGDKVISLIKDRINIIDVDYIGVHFRNTDYKNDINEIFSQLDYLIDDYSIVYWATDDPSSIDVARERYGARAKILNFSHSLDSALFGAPNIHCIPEQLLLKHGVSKLDQVSDFFMDLALLSKSSNFISIGYSSIRHFVKLLRQRTDLYQSFFRI